MWDKITRRRLPHWEIGGAIYFVTWRCSPNITLSEAEREIVLRAVLHWNNVRWQVYAAVVMADHVHVMTRPLTDENRQWELSDLLHSVKGFSAHEITRLRLPTAITREAARSRSGNVWQDERYDRWIRDERGLEEAWDYIVANPVRAGLVSAGERYPWLFLCEG